MYFPRIRWQEFFDKLEAHVGKYGCDSNKEGQGAKRILRRMGYKPAKVADVLEACQMTGGFCDCEILLNTAFYFESTAFEKAVSRLLAGTRKPDA